MVCLNRFLGCCLASLLGLASFSVSAAAPYAETYPNEGLAKQACDLYLDYLRAEIPSHLVERQASLNPLAACNATQSGSSSPETRRFAPAMLMCSASSYPAGDCPTFVSLSPSVVSLDIRQSLLTAGSPFPLVEFFTSSQDCSSVPGFQSRTLRAPTANGSGNVCIDSCVASVAIGYIGTYPSGYLEFDFSFTGAVCTSEPAPVDTPLSDDPLDLPPDDGGVEDVPDPGDGTPGSSGGGSCDAPPSCSGDSLRCNILFQTWATRCAVENGGIPGDGQDVIDGLDRVGDGVDGTNQRLDDVNQGLDRVGDGVDGTNQRLDDVNQGLDRVGDGVDGLRNDLSGAFSDGGVGTGAGLSELGGLVGSKEWGPGDIDSTGWGFPRTCPLWQDVTFDVGTHSMTLPFSSFTLHCTIFEWTGYLIVAFASFWAAMILIRS